MLRKMLQRIGMHPDDPESIDLDLTGRRAVVIATNHGMLDVDKPTGVFSSELTVPCYRFLDAGMDAGVNDVLDRGDSEYREARALAQALLPVAE